MHVGAVNYHYRIARTETTVGQWLDFVRAYAPYYNGPVNDVGFTGLWIQTNDADPRRPNGYAAEPGSLNRPADMSWRFAAIYCNWLHNGKNASPEAFARSAYDTSTFSDNSDRTFNDQLTRSPGARFWIPSLNEWTKAMHYSPDRYGPGEEGYWLYQIGRSDPSPIPGYPWDGGETAAGLPLDPDHYLDVGSYPDVQSPWGLLDGSGGVWEWTETANITRETRFVRGSQQYFDTPEFTDRIDNLSNGRFPTQTGPGLRIASIIPSPSTALSAFVLLALAPRRRNRTSTS